VKDNCGNFYHLKSENPFIMPSPAFFEKGITFMTNDAFQPLAPLPCTTLQAFELLKIPKIAEYLKQYNELCHFSEFNIYIRKLFSLTQDHCHLMVPIHKM
jgi:hypothetical protein